MCSKVPAPGPIPSSLCALCPCHQGPCPVALALHGHQTEDKSPRGPEALLRDGREQAGPGRQGAWKPPCLLVERI